jgi:hypothetical protein
MVVLIQLFTASQNVPPRLAAKEIQNRGQGGSIDEIEQRNRQPKSVPCQQQCQSHNHDPDYLRVGQVWVIVIGRHISSLIFVVHSRLPCAQKRRRICSTIRRQLPEIGQPCRLAGLIVLEPG